MQTFTYKKTGFENLNIFTDRVKRQGFFFLSDLQSKEMVKWVMLGFNWTICYKTYSEMLKLAKLLKARLCIFENGKLLECFDFEAELNLTLAQEINVKDPLYNDAEWIEGTGGIIKEPDNMAVYQGVSLEFIPRDGFSFVGWFDSEGKLLSNERIYDLVLEEGLTIIARSQKLWYNVSCTYDNKMGLVNGLGRYVDGSEVVLTAIGIMGYKFSAWEGGYMYAIRTVYVHENINLEVFFEVNDVVVNAQVFPVGAGSITNVRNVTQEGQMADFLAEAEGSYIFDQFTFASESDPTGDEIESSRENPVSIKLLAGRNITARFKLPGAQVTVNTVYSVKDPSIAGNTFTNGITGGTVTNKSDEVSAGSFFESTASPAEGFDFVGWFSSLNGGVAITTNLTCSIECDGSARVIYARFQKKWFTVKPVKGAYIESVEVGPSLPPYDEGGSSLRVAYGDGAIVYCTLFADNNDFIYSFDGWYEDGVKIEGEGTTATIEPVTRDITWTAKGKRSAVPLRQVIVTPCFKDENESTYYESSLGGSTSVVNQVYKNGEHVSITATTASAEGYNYFFDGYFTEMNGGENLSYSKVYGFTVDKDVHIYARFSRTAVA